MKHKNTLYTLSLIAIIAGCLSPLLLAQTSGKKSGPSISTPTGKTARPEDPYKRHNYPWHKNITATVFWIGEKPTPNNLTPNKASSWDTKWQSNYGGFDNPDPAHRIGYRPRAFTPKQNPFYIALPYNDVVNHLRHKPEASKVVPWFRRALQPPGKTTCKGRWVQIIYNGKSCFAQWEDCGPFSTTDYEYVFLNRRPKNKSNDGAGIDVSPAVRDYLKLKSGGKVHWRFIDFRVIRHLRGPWTMYGKNNPYKDPKQDPDYIANVRYMNYLRKIRDNAYKKK